MDDDPRLHTSLEDIINKNHKRDPPIAKAKPPKVAIRSLLPSQ